LVKPTFRRPEITDEFYDTWRTDGIPVADICRKAGISQATYWVGCFNPAGLLCVPARYTPQLDANPPIAVAHTRLAREGWWHGQNKTRRIYRNLLQLEEKARWPTANGDAAAKAAWGW
jgi:hypothetical protein